MTPETEVAGAEVAGAEVAGAEVAGAEVAGAEVAGAEVAGAEVAGAEVAGAEVAGAEAEVAAAVTGAVAEVTADVTGAVADVTPETAVAGAELAGAVADVTGAVAEVTADVTGAVADVTVEVTGAVAEVTVDGSGIVAACACRENTSKTARIPAAKIATCIARRAMCRKIGCGMSSSHPTGEDRMRPEMPTTKSPKRAGAIYFRPFRSGHPELWAFAESSANVRTVRPSPYITGIGRTRGLRIAAANSAARGLINPR